MLLVLLHTPESGANSAAPNTFPLLLLCYYCTRFSCESQRFGLTVELEHSICNLVCVCVLVEILGVLCDMTLFLVKFLVGIIRKSAFGPSDKRCYLAK